MKKLTFLTTVILAANLLFAQGYHIDTSFYSEALHENKMVDIYFPPGYDENPDLYYPVIYYLHYWFGDQNTMVSEMMSTTQTLINNGTIEPVIMVGADNSPDYPFNGSMYTNSILWGNYEDYMVEDLVNWIESSFRAVPSRNYRALLGHSMGGYGCWRYGTSHKDKFKVLAATAAPFLNLTDSTFSWSRTKILQQCVQTEPPYFYDYNNGSTTMGMFLFCGAFCPNLNTPQTYINPAIVEFALNENGNYIDTIVNKLKANSIDHLIHLVEPSDSLGILFGCGAADFSYIENHLAFKDSLDMLDLPYEYYSHNGGHIMPAGFKQRALIFIDSLLMSPIIPSNSCLPEGITFTTQEEIDNFQINHPNCTEIEGGVMIDGDDITNLEGLGVVTSIAGSLSIGFNSGNAALTSLTGLDNLTSIGGSLSVSDNEVLISLTGLEGLSSIEGDISITRNFALTSLDGLNNLTSIAGDLIIGKYDDWWFYGNPLLSNLEALNNLTFIGGDVTISNNDALTSLDGMESLTSIGGGLQIGGYNFWKGGGHGNDALTSLEGLGNLISVGGYLDISGNSSLTSLEGLGSLSSVGGYFQIVNSVLTSMDGLINLNSIGETCWIQENDSLTSFEGLGNLTSIGEGLWIFGNNALDSLTGLDNLTSIGGDLIIFYNDALSSLTGLDSINAGSINELTITNNLSLSTCHATSICEYLSAPNGTIEIHDNAPGCNSPEEVLNICIQGVEKEETLNGPDFDIYPSPVNDFATLQFQLDQACIGFIEIFNATGVRIQSRQFKMDNAGQQHFVLDFRSLPVGIYLCKVQIGNRIVAKKIIKQ
jgi:S-formylglutathione hydrolase FrmB